jgi:hypothetical protein
MNALIFGCGSKFGLSLRQELEIAGYTVWGVTGQLSESEQILQVNWNTCDIADFEKFLRKLPPIDLIIFNQNAHGVNDTHWKLSSTHIFEIWKNSKNWKQDYYVNCILPTHVLQTLSTCRKIQEHACVIWMLSLSMFGHQQTPPDYIGQKYQNYINLQKLALSNNQTFLGICPRTLTLDNYTTKANSLISFIQHTTSEHSGKFFVFDDPTQTFILYPVDQKSIL